MKRNNILIFVEVLVMGGIVFGWFAPLLFPSEEEENSQRWDVHFVFFSSSGEGFFNAEVPRGLHRGSQRNGGAINRQVYKLY